MKNKKQSVSILVSSCDAYSDAWLPFFTLLKKYWPDRPYPVYLNTERKVVPEVAGIPVISLNCFSKNATWSARLIHALRQIHTKYVIFFLEDFFLLEPVDGKEIDRCIELMEQNPKIANVNFGKGSDVPIEERIDEDYAVRARDTTYYLNAQCALWRRKTLLKLLSPYESAWQMEIFGSKRAAWSPYKFVVRTNEKRIFFYHSLATFGYGIRRGKWLPGNRELFQKEGITVNFDRLGIETEEPTIPDIPPPKRTFYEKRLRLLYAGVDIPRWELKDQRKLFFSHPIEYLKKKRRALRDSKN